MNTMANSVLNAHVANETRAVSGNGSCVENKHTREAERDDMWMCFLIGITLGIAYLTIDEKNGLEDFFYLFIYTICQGSVYSLHWDDKQPAKAVKTSLVLSMILSLVMLVPFIMDMDTQIHFHECVGGFGINGSMHYVYRDYTDYSNLIEISVMLLFCVMSVVRPLYHLYKMK